ncbi:MAG: anoctamin [archaeon]|nr:anoctamin [archaeon]
MDIVLPDKQKETLETAGKLFAASIAKSFKLGLNELESLDKPDKIANQMVELYPGGIKDVIEGEGPKKNEPHLIFFFTCPKSFYEKYSVYDDKLTTLPGIETIDDDAIDAFSLEILQCTQKNRNDTLRANEIGRYTDLTTRITRLLGDIMESFNDLTPELLDSVIAKHKEIKAEEIKKQIGEEEYKKMDEIFSTFPHLEGEHYSYLCYEDFVIIFIRLIAWSLNLKLKIDFSDNPTVFLLSMFAEENALKHLAVLNEYELKLKAYAYKFQIEQTRAEKKYEFDTLEDGHGGLNILSSNYEEARKAKEEQEKKEAEEKKIMKPLKYSDMKYGDVVYWPPHVPYEIDKDEKFQRYENNDDYHECNVNYDTDEVCGKCTVFRNIDKIRLIYMSVDRILKFNAMMEEKFLRFVLIKRNYKDYGDKLSAEYLLKKAWNLYDRETQVEHFFIIRNFYGEKICYYFMWLKTFLQRLLKPAIIGILVFIAKMILQNRYQKIYELVIIGYLVVIPCWGCIFNDIWLQKERFYNFIWGTENFKHLEPDSELFKPDGLKQLIFFSNFPYVSPCKKYAKKFLSYFVMGIMLSLTIAGTFTLFYFKKICIKDRDPDALLTTIIGLGFTIAVTVQVKILSFIYKILAKIFNMWENHQKDFERTNSLAFKLILFEFVNSYFPYYYIAFIKGRHFFEEVCVDDDCIGEITTQLRTTFLMNLGFNALEIGLPVFSYLKNKREIEKKKDEFREAKTKKKENESKKPKEEFKEAKEIELNTTSSEDKKEGLLEEENKELSSQKPLIEETGIEADSENEETEGIKKYVLKPHSLEHQLVCESYDDCSEEYSEMLIQFGFVTLFTVAEPLTPIIVFFLMYIEKFVDTFKLFFLVRMDIIEQGTGLEIYNGIFKGLTMAGILSNFAIIIFSDDFALVPNNEDGTVSDDQIFLFLLLCIGVFLLSLMVGNNILPEWFQHKDQLLQLYQRKYYYKDGKSLPHLYVDKLVKRKIHNNKYDKKEKNLTFASSSDLE